jgi:gluconokinase
VNNNKTASKAIILMGVSGSGKSTVGQLLAEELRCSFIEGDDFHGDGNIAKMQAGLPLNDADRWPWLERIGQAAQLAIAKDRIVVVSCSALKKAYRDRLGAAIGAPTAFVLLEVGQAELLTRLENRNEHFMPASLLHSQLELLERPGSDENALILNAGASPTELSKSIREWLRSVHPKTPSPRHPDAGQDPS